MFNFISNIVQNQICGSISNPINIQDCAENLRSCEFLSEKECLTILSCQNYSFPPTSAKVISFHSVFIIFCFKNKFINFQCTSFYNSVVNSSICNLLFLLFFELFLSAFHCKRPCFLLKPQSKYYNSRPLYIRRSHLVTDARKASTMFKL